MRIIVTNDDGIYSPGLAALAKVATRFGQVYVVAPDVEQSSMGHAVTHSRPLSLKKSPILFEGIEAFRVNGTPADCVALGTHLYAKADLVLSGINLGANLGNSMWHSGTLAAAKQAVLLGIKGIAFSTHVAKSEPDFNVMALHVEKILAMLIECDFGLYNVNVPENPKGVKWTRQSVRFYDGHIVPAMDPMGRKHYWFTVTPLEAAEEGTDRWAMEQGYISITPLRLDLTNYELLKRLEAKQSQTVS
jgi:5'/3'-nucleotidase